MQTCVFKHRFCPKCGSPVYSLPAEAAITGIDLETGRSHMEFWDLDGDAECSNCSYMSMWFYPGFIVYDEQSGGLYGIVNNETVYVVYQYSYDTRGCRLLFDPEPQLLGKVEANDLTTALYKALAGTSGLEARKLLEMFLTFVSKQGMAAKE